MEVYLMRSILLSYFVVPTIQGYVVSDDETYSDSYGYGAIIDAGSSGSKLVVYKWSQPWTLSALPDIDMLYSTKVCEHISDYSQYKIGLRGF